MKFKNILFIWITFSMLSVVTQTSFSHPISKFVLFNQTGKLWQANTVYVGGCGCFEGNCSQGPCTPKNGSAVHPRKSGEKYYFEASPNLCAGDRTYYNIPGLCRDDFTFTSGNNIYVGKNKVCCVVQNGKCNYNPKAPRTCNLPRVDKEKN